MIQLIDPIDWVHKLVIDCPIFDGRVFKTIPDADLQIDQFESPAAFVYIDSDKSGGNEVVGSIRQTLESHVTVEIHVRRTATLTDKFNESASEKLRQARIDVLNALVGWKPANTIQPNLHASGELNKKDKKVLKFTETFTTRTVLKAQVTT